ncbi:MAG: glutamate formimidoyltransferase [Cytophagaceae bacterium]|jgi:glutamate formiminotransferase/formiminotetrahydrofolate cyclodeaminase|nr:glutamate formimidoyltransferase [Cytophagaceae bacterium]
MKQLIECVPNFSEGRNSEIISQITREVETVDGVKLIDVDPGKATNRTVVTFVGTPDEVCEAAFRAAKKAAEMIDMRLHKGEHPRFGAIDVCPLVPVANITMDEVVVYARKLAKRFADELGIPVYCYEFAANEEKRRNLANNRQGEYEGLPNKIASAEWHPDFGPCEWNESVARTGATAVGARNFLVAYNVNLNTTSVRRANSVAFDVRERGRVKRDGDPIAGKTVKDANGNPVYEAGLLKSVKAIGWFIEEYGVAQISMNLTDITVTPLHTAFDTVCDRANARGLRVTGSELVGVVPLQSMLDTGKFFLAKQQRSTGLPDAEIIRIAVKSLGLDELTPFDPKKKIIEYLLEEPDPKSLIKLTCEGFADKTASEEPAPGGGSVSAYLAALGASLGTMVANLSSHKRGWDARWKEFSDWAERGMALQKQLLRLVDKDTAAFNAIMDAFGLPKGNDSEKTARSKAIREATINAIEIPFRVMQTAYDCFDLLEQMAKEGNPNSVSDAGVGVLCVRSAVMGAYLNVQINAASLKDDPTAKDLVAKGAEIEINTIRREKEILEVVKGKI